MAPKRFSGSGSGGGGGSWGSRTRRSDVYEKPWRNVTAASKSGKKTPTDDDDDAKSSSSSYGGSKSRSSSFGEDDQNEMSFTSNRQRKRYERMMRRSSLGEQLVQPKPRRHSNKSYSSAHTPHNNNNNNNNNNINIPRLCQSSSQSSQSSSRSSNSSRSSTPGIEISSAHTASTVVGVASAEAHDLPEEEKTQHQQQSQQSQQLQHLQCVQQEHALDAAVRGSGYGVAGSGRGWSLFSSQYFVGEKTSMCDPASLVEMYRGQLQTALAERDKLRSIVSELQNKLAATENQLQEALSLIKTRATTAAPPLHPNPPSAIWNRVFTPPNVNPTWMHKAMVDYQTFLESAPLPKDLKDLFNNTTFENSNISSAATDDTKNNSQRKQSFALSAQAKSWQPSTTTTSQDIDQKTHEPHSLVPFDLLS